MQKIVECVPNFSEGRNQSTIDQICQSINIFKEVQLLNVESDKDYNRTVITLAGEPQQLMEAIFQATKTALDLIDMRIHKGEHPRIGAVDVVPFVPIRNVSMDDCVKLANIYGERIARELKVPVYLYEFAARSPARQNLSNIRRGGYEKLEEKLRDPVWKPDYGEAIFNAKSGALVTGARKFLIAYNINLKAADIKFADEIASYIRESGRIARNIDGKLIKNEIGQTLKIPGNLKAVKAIGVRLSRFDITQVSMNLTDYEITSMHDAYEEVKKQAQLRNIELLGSELVGLAPLEVFLKAGRFYADNKSLSEKELVELAIKKLGLDYLAPFEPNKKILEYMI